MQAQISLYSLSCNIQTGVSKDRQKNAYPEQPLYSQSDRILCCLLTNSLNNIIMNVPTVGKRLAKEEYLVIVFMEK